MVCSSVRARERSLARSLLVYIRGILYSGIARKQGVYEISRLYAGGAFAAAAAVLSQVRWIYSRSISRDFLPVNLRPLRRRDATARARRATRSSDVRGGENLHAFSSRKRSGARGGGNSGKNPLLSRERRCIVAARCRAPFSLGSSYNVCVIELYLDRLSKVMSREQRGDNSKNFRANIGAALLSVSLSLCLLHRAPRLVNLPIIPSHRRCAEGSVASFKIKMKNRAPCSARG